MGACITTDQFKDWMCDRLEQGNGQTGRQGNAECIAITGRIFGCDEAALTGDAHLEQATSTH